jgi:hypothetical protein
VQCKANSDIRVANDVSTYDDGELHQMLIASGDSPGIVLGKVVSSFAHRARSRHAETHSNNMMHGIILWICRRCQRLSRLEQNDPFRYRSGTTFTYLPKRFNDHSLQGDPLHYLEKSLSDNNVFEEHKSQGHTHRHAKCSSLPCPRPVFPGNTN